MGTGRSCTALDACHTAGTCNAATGVCSNPLQPTGTQCSDGNLCNGMETCNASGVCIAGTPPPPCSAQDACHTAGTCNTATGLCSNPVATNGTTCSDGNACTQNDSCQNGACQSGPAVTCTASDQCHVAGTCDTTSGTCSNPAAANGTACTGTPVCNRTFACAGGTCTASNPAPCTASTSPNSTLAAGELETCALLANGTVQCWGYNGDGELGNGTTLPSPIPVTVPGLSGVTAISGSAKHECALLSDGTVRCWGHNSSGQVGDPNTAGSNALVPVPVAGLTGVVSIAASDFGESGPSCALLSNGTVQCWGANSLGQLGNGTTTGSTAPVSVSGLSGAAIAVTANGYGACALIANGTVQCWGYNGEGELGIGTTGPDYCYPNGTWPCSKTAAAAVSGLSGVTAIASSDGANGHTCALLSNGTVKCWGFNAYGQLGEGRAGGTGGPGGGCTARGISATSAPSAIRQKHMVWPVVSNR